MAAFQIVDSLLVIELLRHSLAIPDVTACHISIFPQYHPSPIIFVTL